MDTTTATALVIQNFPRGGPGRWAPWLTAAGVTPVVVRAYEGEPVPERLGHAALLVLGGGYLPDEDDRAPWLAPTRALARQALDEGVPYFGICLGGQLLAQVAGGEVRGEHGRPEFGSTRLRLRPETAGDPLFDALPPGPAAIQNHVDAITRLPAGAHWLADSEHCPYQAFRVGERAWGVQFHPEAEPDGILRWNEDRLRRYGHERGALHRAAAADDAEAAAVWGEVAGRFGALVRGDERAERCG
ncbi:MULTISPECIES: type 1 glutamine amidotransferase [Streptomyces]|uniref:Aminotransferase n=4 Tax=Streptomyces TaxID=1883 RepID=A0A8H9HT46_9ACTN|nr:MULTISPECIES: type 1 glutamine amidotransferase [Streptomyces]NEC11711.1 type 1 glutamine amidotransferase [Streptomyces sp. SID8014]NEE25575.1 type 1 glutamine amidotransferase [Streptomyces sp. SID7982]NEE56198.1 type 1 glutamine amidotransferase [Streptomyces sp. SID8455]PJM83152.1 aminotransferase [Streptomyces sp. TSRI0384-2]QNE81841.1 type 1 glutamine amidotransferase [Streptomyces rutgersensis]